MKICLLIVISFEYWIILSSLHSTDGIRIFEINFDTSNYLSTLNYDTHTMACICLLHLIFLARILSLLIKIVLLLFSSTYIIIFVLEIVYNFVENLKRNCVLHQMLLTLERLVSNGQQAKVYVVKTYNYCSICLQSSNSTDH